MEGLKGDICRDRKDGERGLHLSTGRATNYRDPGESELRRLQAARRSQRADPQAWGAREGARTPAAATRGSQLNSGESRHLEKRKGGEAEPCLRSLLTRTAPSPPLPAVSRRKKAGGAGWCPGVVSACEWGDPVFLLRTAVWGWAPRGAIGDPEPRTKA